MEGGATDSGTRWGAPHQPVWFPCLGEDLSFLCLCLHWGCGKHDSPALNSLHKTKVGEIVGSTASPAWASPA